MLPGGRRPRKKDGFGQKRALQIGILAVAMTMAAFSLVDPRHITESTLLQTKLCSVVYCPGQVRAARDPARPPVFCMCLPIRSRTFGCRGMGVHRRKKGWRHCPSPPLPPAPFGTSPAFLCRLPAVPFSTA